MNNLDLNNNADLLTAIANLEGDMASTEIVLTRSITNTVCYRLMAKLVKSSLATPKQAAALATVYTANLETLVQGNTDEWVRLMTGSLQGIMVNSEALAVFNALPMLQATNYVDVVNGKVSLGKAVLGIIHMDMRSTAPTLVGEELDRKRNYGRTDYGQIAAGAIHGLEDTPFMRSEYMLDMARKVWVAGTRAQREFIDTERYVLNGTAAMIRGAGYFSEFFFDQRGRSYQAAYYGPNGQTSDMSRSMMDLHGVSTDYDSQEAYKLLDEEIHDMFKGGNDVYIRLVREALADPVKFILEHLEDGKSGQVSKPWNFVKAIYIMNQLELGNRPYIGIAVGYDAKCSGPQLGAAMVACEAILIACGMTRGELTDVYMRAVKECDKKSIKGMNRGSMKKAFMAVFYGAGWLAMMDADTIEEEAFNTLWVSGANQQLANIDEGEILAKLFLSCIEAAMGSKLRQLRSAIKSAGYDWENEMCKYNAPMTHRMPDGFEVAMDYRIQLDIDGQMLSPDVDVPNCLVEGVGVTRFFEKPTFKTAEYDLESYGRKGFVNMIQATDGQLARLIVLHCKKLGVKHIISVHDCFRVSINETGLLKQAIINSYQELFGTKENIGGEFTNDLDILRQYFEGSQAATKKEYKVVNLANRQFFNNGWRILRSVGGTEFTELVADIDGTTYFGK